MFCFISIWKFRSFKNPFVTITSLSELYFRFRGFILLVETEKRFLWIMAVGQAAGNHKGETWIDLTWLEPLLDLMLMMRDKYISSNLNHLTKFSSSRSAKFKYILPWKISQMITKTIPMSMRIGIPSWIWWRVNGNWDNNMIRILEQEEINKIKRTKLRKSLSAIRVGKLPFE